MPNGPSYTGSPVASIEGGNAWMDQVNLQIDLMRRQQAMNIEGQRVENARVAKERETAIQNAYDFDTTSLDPKQAELLAAAQKAMADNISGHGYQTSQMLTHDVASLANLYNKLKADSLLVKENSDGYYGVTDYGNGMEGRGDQPGYELNSQAWYGTGDDPKTDKAGNIISGGTGAYEVNTEPGSLGIIAQEYGVDGSKIGEGMTDIMGHQTAKGFFQQSIVQANPVTLMSLYNDNAGGEHPTLSGAVTWGENQWAAQPENGEIRLKALETWQRKYPKGNLAPNDDQLKDLWMKGVKDSWKSHQAPAPLSTGLTDIVSRYTDDKNNKHDMYELAEPLEINIGEGDFVGSTVYGIGRIDEDNIVIDFEDVDGSRRREVINRNDEFNGEIFQSLKQSRQNAWFTIMRNEAAATADAEDATTTETPPEATSNATTTETPPEATVDATATDGVEVTTGATATEGQPPADQRLQDGPPNSTLFRQMFHSDEDIAEGERILDQRLVAKNAASEKATAALSVDDYLKNITHDENGKGRKNTGVIGKLARRLKNKSLDEQIDFIENRYKDKDGNFNRRAKRAFKGDDLIAFWGIEDKLKNTRDRSMGSSADRNQQARIESMLRDAPKGSTLADNPSAATTVVLATDKVGPSTGALMEQILKFNPPTEYGDAKAILKGATAAATAKANAAAAAAQADLNNAALQAAAEAAAAAEAEAAVDEATATVLPLFGVPMGEHEDKMKLILKPLIYSAMGSDINNPQDSLGSSVWNNPELQGGVPDWCAAMAYHILTANGRTRDQMPSGVEGLGAYANIRAKDYLNIGTNTSLEEAKKGDLVVFKRPLGGYHVAFYMGEGSDGKIKAYGGNQNNQLKISEYDENEVIDGGGIRRLDIGGLTAAQIEEISNIAMSGGDLASK